MKQGSTLFLKLVIALMVAGVLAICILALPPVIWSEIGRDSGILPILFGLYLPVLPFFFALYQAFTLLNAIDKNTAFSQMSIRALKRIKYSAIVISLIFAAGLPYASSLSHKNEGPGLGVFAFIIIAASVVVATFAAVLELLIQNGVDLKSENDLTV